MKYNYQDREVKGLIVHCTNILEWHRDLPYLNIILKLLLRRSKPDWIEYG